MATELLQSRAMCACGPKRWTRIIATTLLAIFVLTAFAGGNIAEHHVSSSKTNEHDGQAMLNSINVTIWALCGFMGFLTLLLLIGNEKDIPILFWPWLMFTSIGMLLAVVEAIRTMIRGVASTGIQLILCVLITGFFLHVVHRRANEFKAALNLRLSMETENKKAVKAITVGKSEGYNHGGKDDAGIELVAF